MRSKLFVPASRPALFEKALASAADAISFDLEDAVVEARKAEARAALHAFLVSNPARLKSKTVIVRVNAIDTPHFCADIAAIVQPGVHLINLPKPESIEHVRAAAAAISEAEQRNRVDVPISLLLNIETPAALRKAVDLAQADPRVVGLQLGLGDLFEPYGIARRSRAAIQHAMLSMRLAASEAGVYAYDSAFADIGDLAGYEAEAMLARHFGFLGKTCIHPNQVAIANAVFQPSELEIAHALKVVAASEAAATHGMGAYQVDGKMIDLPFERRARDIVSAAKRYGRLAH
jgi:citrate lyase subunit beta / citryl-CoA lyase